VAPVDIELWINENFAGQGARLCRLEQFQEYAPTDEYLAWSTEGPGALDRLIYRPMSARVSRERVRGIRRHRVRIIRQSPTDYLAYQVALYDRLVRAGEDVRILDLSERNIPEGLLSLTDYDWVSITSGDGTHYAAAMVYDTDGIFVTGSPLDADVAAQLAEARNLLREAGEDFLTWHARHPTLAA
jgi:hypothetical protein